VSTHARAAAAEVVHVPARSARGSGGILRPLGALRELGRRTADLDQAPVSQTVGGTRLRRGAAVLLAGYAVVNQVQTNLHGTLISPFAFLLAMVAVALYLNRTGRFLRDWVPVLFGIIAYGVTVMAVPRLGVPVHYMPQIDADRVLGFGTLPTAWLQEHLYHGRTGAIEVFSFAMYLSHFLAPLILAFLLWAVWNGRGFRDLLFGILAVSILGDITFLAAPTAPPWLAAEHGLIPPIHQVLRDTLYDLHLNAAAVRKGDASSYNIVAAIPSLHVAWPVVCLLVIRKHRLPRWLFAAQLVLGLSIVFAVVYTGEHYLIDAVVGVFYAVAAWWLVQRLFRMRKPVDELSLQPAPVRN
jgi:PAP2 superfamily protein